jgi:hypothetical protein
LLCRGYLRNCSYHNPTEPIALKQIKYNKKQRWHWSALFFCFGQISCLLENFDEAAFLKMATPDAELENFGVVPNEQWRCTPDTSRFGYAAIAYIQLTVDKAYKEAIGPYANKNGVRLLATDFISP